MTQQNDPLAQFAVLTRRLVAERETIRKRLGEIDSVLAGRTGIPARSVKATARPRRGSKRPKNKLSMREAVAKVTASKALSLPEIVKEVQNLGYRFATKNPQNSVGAFLYGYGKKHFKRINGKFSPK